MFTVLDTPHSIQHRHRYPNIHICISYPPEESPAGDNFPQASVMSRWGHVDRCPMVVDAPLLLIPGVWMQFGLSYSDPDFFLKCVCDLDLRADPGLIRIQCFGKVGSNFL